MKLLRFFAILDMLWVSLKYGNPDNFSIFAKNFLEQPEHKQTSVGFIFPKL